MNAPPALSVVIANFDNAAYLDECLESVLAQTFADFEVLLVDDRSRDDSAARIRRWAAHHPRRVRALFNPVNVGVARSRQRAIAESRGAFLTTLDSDDYYAEPVKLEREMALASACLAAGEPALVFSDIARVRADGTLIARDSQRLPLREGFILADILARACLIPRDFVMPRAAYFAVGGYDGHFPIYEDWDLKIRLAERYPFRFSGGVGTAYRRHGRGLSAAPLGEHIDWLNRVFEKNLPRADPARRDEIRAAFTHFTAGLAARIAAAATGPADLDKRKRP